jgi:hypothetical protein
MRNVIVVDMIQDGPVTERGMFAETAGVAMRLYAWTTLVLVIALAFGQAASACVDTAQTRKSVFARMMPDGDIILESGEALHIPGLAFVSGTGGIQARTAVAAGWVGRSIAISVVSPADRWGRVVGYIKSAAAPSGSADELGTELLVSGGFMLVPEAVPSTCLDTWRKAERRAIHNRAGIWGQTPPSFVEAAAPVGASLGQRIVVLGRISSVGVRPGRTYINFGGPGSGAATASMSPFAWRKLVERGLTPEALRGRNALVRGHVAGIDPRWMLDVDDAASVEVE